MYWRFLFLAISLLCSSFASGEHIFYVKYPAEYPRFGSLEAVCDYILGSERKPENDVYFKVPPNQWLLEYRGVAFEGLECGQDSVYHPTFYTAVGVRIEGCPADKPHWDPKKLECVKESPCADKKGQPAYLKVKRENSYHDYFELNGCEVVVRTMQCRVVEATGEEWCFATSAEYTGESGAGKPSATSTSGPPDKPEEPEEPEGPDDPDTPEEPEEPETPGPDDPDDEGTEEGTEEGSEGGSSTTGSEEEGEEEEGDLTFTGPELPDDRANADKMAQSLMRHIYEAPIVKAIKQLSPPNTGGTCPKYSFDLGTLGMHTLDQHCDFINRLRGALSILFKAMWTLAAVIVFLKL
ncbi:hypothetical protein [Spartinivicinus ruber]|uniref:hypothetical protein n=1 Tax=Spartinivicinus ruber TaxID=2683272 RepID=UPI0013D73EE8|nr:hypothetical protein [Spartinivicinus ruber]